MAAVLTRGLQRVRGEFNDAFERRDKASDGWVGDLAHQIGTSGHNPDRTGKAEYRDGDALDEVRAIDVDRDLVPGSKIDWMERVIQYLVRKARAGGYIPFRYVIYKSRIWRRTTGWQTEAYTGANTHDHHAHFSGDFTEKADNWSGTLGLASLTEEEDVPLTKADAQLVAQAVWAYPLDIDTSADGENMQPAGGILRYLDPLVKGTAGKVDGVRDLVSALDRREAGEVPPSVEAIAARVAQVITAMPEVTVNVSAADLQAAVIGAIHQISAPEKE